MNWDLWRIDWPNAAPVLALAIVPFFAMALHLAGDEQRSPTKAAGVSVPVAMLDIVGLPSQRSE